MESTTTAPILLSETREEVLYLTLNRPEKRNALSHELLLQLHAALDAIAADTSVRVVVLAARGPARLRSHVSRGRRWIR